MFFFFFYYSITLQRKKNSQNLESSKDHFLGGLMASEKHMCFFNSEIYMIMSLFSIFKTITLTFGFFNLCEIMIRNLGLRICFL